MSERRSVRVDAADRRGHVEQVGVGRDAVGLQDELLGTFELISLESRRSDGAITFPFGDEPIGMFMFDQAGRFSVQVSDHVRSSEHGGYLAMFGSYVVDERRRAFTLRVTGVSVGGPQVGKVKRTNGVR